MVSEEHSSAAIDLFPRFKMDLVFKSCLFQYFGCHDRKHFFIEEKQTLLFNHFELRKSLKAE